MKYIIIATTNTTKNTPTPIPALNISPITEQLENIVIMEISNAVMNVYFFIAVYQFWVNSNHDGHHFLTRSVHHTFLICFLLLMNQRLL